MAKAYSMNDLGIESLVGLRVKTAQINEERDLVVLDTDKGARYLTWEGSCCANCFLAGATGTEALIDATITEAKNAEWSDVSRNREQLEVVESMGTNITTTKGRVSLESRVEHNGYYDGSILVSDDAPMNQYHSPRYNKGDVVSLAPLTDF